MSQQLEDEMTDLNLDLAHKAEQLPGFKERPGMVYSLGGCFAGREGVIISTPALTGRTYYVADVGMLSGGDGDVLDYRHPATAGWLLAMLGPGWYGGSESTADGRSWGWVDNADVAYGEDRPEGNTLGEACIRAAIARGGWGVR